MYPGQAPTIRRNLFNVMVVLDLSRPESLYFTANTISMLVDRSYPTRIGFVPVVETEDGVKMARVFYYLTQSYGRLATIKFFRSVREVCVRLFAPTHYSMPGSGSAGRERRVGLVQRSGSIRSARVKRGDPRGRRADLIRYLDQRVFGSPRREDQQGSGVCSTAGRR
jgi:hypothetical protein